MVYRLGIQKDTGACLEIFPSRLCTLVLVHGFLPALGAGNEQQKHGRFVIGVAPTMRQISMEKQGIPRSQLVAITSYLVIEFTFEAVDQLMTGVSDPLLSVAAPRLQGHDKGIACLFDETVAQAF